MTYEFLLINKVTVSTWTFVTSTTQTYRIMFIVLRHLYYLIMSFGLMPY